MRIPNRIGRADTRSNFGNYFDRFNLGAFLGQIFTNANWHRGKSGLAVVRQRFERKDGVEFRIECLGGSKSVGQRDPGLKQRVNVEVILRFGMDQNYFHLLHRKIEKRRDINVVVLAAVRFADAANGKSAEK